ncbi:unnamed protein product [Rhizoctonia solani]|uniref:Ricin B lectin domain-containing protein n=1 Tax=Rhizoctonia solani TaxID=456999 RepID=A0A8H3HJM9_9AGAM|nr:unnamed protein product [Rhizoctonia solani]
MGPKIYQSRYQSDKDLEPGAYQILNAHKGTAIQVSEHDPTQVVAWKRHDEENQQWCLQRSGDGYRLQNKHYVDAFLAASSTDNKGLVYASKYPTTWMFLLYNGNYIIQLADRNRVLDLYHGSGRNGTMIRIHKEDGTHMPRRIWRLKRLRSSGDCESKEPSKLRTLLHQRDDTIRQLRQELKSKEEVLSHAYKAIEEFALLRNQYELLESKLSQQQAEIASRQAKADGISHSQFPPDQDLKPGTYRILNALTGTANQVSDHDPTKVVAWEKHNGANQKWLLKRSGEGYQLQNRRHRGYLAVLNGDNHALVYANRHPTTWVFLKSGRDHIVQLAGKNRVLDLHNGLRHNGNEIDIWNLDGNNMAYRTWSLERLDGDFESGYFIVVMIEISHSQFPPDQDLKPGTYRILNTLTGTAIQVSDHDPTKVVAWEQHDGENQQWLLQRSGEGYQLQNRRDRAYLAVCNTDNHALVYASRYPTTWVFLKSSGNYIIQFADRNRVLDLHNGLGHNGNEIHIWNVDGNNMAHRTWRLECLGGDPGNKELTGIQEEIANKNNELLQLQGELSTAKQELSDLHSLLYQRDETISQLQQDLKLKEEASSHAYESKISQQQTEIASLQAKMDRVEYLMSQMMSKPGGSTGTTGTT